MSGSVFILKSFLVNAYYFVIMQITAKKSFLDLFQKQESYKFRIFFFSFKLTYLLLFFIKCHFHCYDNIIDFVLHVILVYGRVLVCCCLHICFRFPTSTATTTSVYYLRYHHHFHIISVNTSCHHCQYHCYSRTLFITNIIINMVLCE